MTWPAIHSVTPYPDVVEGLKLLFPRWYPELATEPDGTFHVGRIFPDAMQQHLPYVRVRDIGGNDDGLTDVPLVDVDVFHLSFKQARDMARGIQAHLLGYPHRVEGMVLDRVTTAMRPHVVPWEDDKVFRYYASYQIHARR